MRTHRVPRRSRLTGAVDLPCLSCKIAARDGLCRGTDDPDAMMIEVVVGGCGPELTMHVKTSEEPPKQHAAFSGALTRQRWQGKTGLWHETTGM